MKAKMALEPVIQFMVKIIENVTALMALLMMFCLFWQVITRFVIKVPSIWTEEVARYSFINMAMLGAALGVKNSTHFGMNLISDKFQGKLREIYDRYLVNGIILISALLITIYGYEFAIGYGLTRVSPTFLVPMAWFFIVIPIAGFFMIIFSLYNVFFRDYSQIYANTCSDNSNEVS